MEPNFVRAMADTVCRLYVSNPHVTEEVSINMYDIAMELYKYADFVEYNCATGPQDISLDELVDEIYFPAVR